MTVYHLCYPLTVAMNQCLSYIIVILMELLIPLLLHHINHCCKARSFSERTRVISMYSNADVYFVTGNSTVTAVTTFSFLAIRFVL